MPEIGDTTVYSQTDANNNTATNPGWPEGMPPSRVNDAARALQGAVTREWNWRSFTLTSTGSANAYVLAYTVAPASLAVINGQEFSFITNFAVTGAATLNINGLGAITIKKDVAGVLTDLASADMASGQYVKVNYNGTFFVWTNWQGPAFSGGTATTSLIMSGKDFRAAKSAAVASATTTDIWTPADGNFVHITGTTTITSLGTAHQAGEERTVIFDGILTLTHNGTSLQLPGAANITTAAGDRMIVRADTTANMIVVDYVKASGLSILSPMQIATITTTSGTTVDYTTVPSWAKRIDITLNGVSTSGTSYVIVQIGNTTPETTAYNSTAREIVTASGTGLITNGFAIAQNTAADNRAGVMTLTAMTGNVWVETHSVMSVIGTPTLSVGAGIKGTGGVITVIRLTTVNGTDTFDAGSFTLTFWG